MQIQHSCGCYTDPRGDQESEQDMSKHPNWHPRDYNSIEELNTELDRLEASHTDGNLKTTGNWSAGQIFDHCSKPMKMAFDGFFDEQGNQVHMPFLARVFGVLVFKNLLGRSHMKPGIKLPASASSMLPPDDCSFEQGLEAIRSQIARIENGERMTMRSPVLGKSSQEQWVLLHLDHCRMHFGFLQYND